MALLRIRDKSKAKYNIYAMFRHLSRKRIADFGNHSKTPILQGVRERNIYAEFTTLK